MKTMIPVKTTTDVTGSCEKEGSTTMAITLKDKVGTVTLGFQVQNMTMIYYSDVEDAVMNSLQLEYDPATVYFPNHGEFSCLEAITLDLDRLKSRFFFDLT